MNHRKSKRSKLPISVTLPVIITLATMAFITVAIILFQSLKISQDIRSQAANPIQYGTLTLKDTQDAWVNRNRPLDNYGHDTQLSVRNGNQMITFLSFDLSSLSGQKILFAKLRLHICITGICGTNQPQSVRLVTTPWNESGISYKNLPSIGAIVAHFGGGSINQWIDTDVLPAINNTTGSKSISFEIDQASANGIYFDSKEKGTDVQPQLVVGYSGTPPVPEISPTPTAIVTPTPLPTRLPTPFPTLKPPSVNFQPEPPYYATFFYNWYKNPTTDGLNQWGIWSDPDSLGAHSPPQNWFSNYLPQQSLYSSDDYQTFKWQISKLAEAKQEVAIASWWGQGDRSDIALTRQLTDFMKRSDNPYPNLRFAVYYECEGNVCNGSPNPTVSQLVSDLNYIAAKFATQPSYLKINGKPVIFVYGDPTDDTIANNTCSDNSVTARWKQANNQASTRFYVVLKVFSGFASDPCQPDSWHQYAPAVRNDQQGSYAYMVSPGFWRSGDPVRLYRDLNQFTQAVQRMVSANTFWKLTETWNEWGEGSAVEPGTQVIQSHGNGVTISDPNGLPFQNEYVHILNTALPPLPNGTGSPY